MNRYAGSLVALPPRLVRFGHSYKASFKKVIQKAFTLLDQEAVKKSIEKTFVDRVSACAKAGGQHFEHSL